MKVVTQVNLTTKNVPGAFAKIGDMLRAHDINIDAVSCQEGGETSVVSLILNTIGSDAVPVAKEVLREMGSIDTEEIIVFLMKNKPGAIAQIGRACSGAGVNIRNMYATTFGTSATVYVSVDDIEKAREGLASFKDDGGKL